MKSQLAQQKNSLAAKDLNDYESYYTQSEGMSQTSKSGLSVNSSYSVKYASKAGLPPLLLNNSLMEKSRELKLKRKKKA